MPMHVPVIALTGSIATGKSTAAAHLARKGAAVIDADAIAHEVYVRNPDLVLQVVETFGRDILDPEGHLDRSALGARIFSSPQLRSLLNELTHPYIRRAMLEQHASALRDAPPLIVHDIPLLYESGLDAIFPRVLVISASPLLQLERLLARSHLTRAEATSRIDAQLPSSIKCQQATWCCENEGTLAELEAKLDGLWADLVDDGEQPRLDLLTTIA